ncbi:MAG TPA: carbon storage regulator CsrA [Lysobacter sp.]|nr:carbon storage regulator CsrA [Lysobacter sp.]
MLILTRRPGEKIIVGEGENQVTILVAEIDGNRTKIGVHAPRNIPVHREEVFERVQREKAAEV